jgi:tetratricopeptide (TPR) repeat protein
MEAVISGQAGVAFLLMAGDQFASIHVGEPDVLTPRAIGDLPFLLGDASDLQFLEGVDHAEVARRLQIDQDKADALQLSLILLDRDLSNEVRLEAVNDLEDLYGSAEVLDHVERILFAHPLPPDADLAGALSLAGISSFVHVGPLLQRLESLQGMIRQVYLAWEQVADKTFNDIEFAREFAAAAVREGVFRDLVLSLSHGRPLSGARLRAMGHPQLRSQPNYRLVLSAWFDRFPKTGKASLPVLEEEVESGMSDHERKASRRAEEKRRTHYRGTDRQGILSKVESQKEAIVEMMKRRNLALARTRIDELIAFQKAYGEPIFLCKSLCDLAQKAKEIGLLGLQLELTERSIKEKPDDGWSWAQYADALLRNSRPREALEAYDQATAYAGGVVARSGRAETLRALNRLDEALAAYDEAIRDFPGDVVPRNGRAETLRTLNRLDEALAAYDETIRDFPSDVFARTGRAETLHTLNRLDEALAAYDETIRDFPENVVARNGRAWILTLLGRGDEALQILPASSPVTAQDWIALHMRGMVLLRQGNSNGAIKIFRQGIERDPSPAQKDFFRTALAVAMLRNKQFQKAGEVIAEIARPSLQMEVNILKLHAFGALKISNRAREAYNELAGHGSPQIRVLADELRLRYIERGTPQHDDDWVFDAELECIRQAA